MTASVMMTTALNARTEDVVSVINLALETRDALHGKRCAVSNGYEMRCRGCHGPVHLVRRGKRMFWRHDPGSGRSCIFGEMKPNGEGEAHFQAKLRVAAAIGSLSGFHVDCERTFEANGDVVRADVYAENERPAGDHQSPMLWEVQLSRQTHGIFVERTRQAREVTGYARAWLTPHGRELGDVRGILTDPNAHKVVDRVYSDPYMSSAMGEIEVTAWLKAVARSRPKLLWSQSGDDGEWISYPPFDNVIAPTTREYAGRSVTEVADRHCDRTPTDVPESLDQVLSAASGQLLLPAERFRPYWAPEDGMACPHKSAHEGGEGRLVCSWCGELVKFP